MKRLVWLALGFLIVLSGCTGTPEDTDEPADRLIVTYQTMSYSRLDGLSRVQNAINKITRAEIGVEIELLPVDAQVSSSSYPLWLSQGERIDLMMLNYQNIQSYIKNGQLLPLDDLLDQYGDGIRCIIDSGYDLTASTMLRGNIYGLDVADNGGRTGGGLWIARSCLEDVGFHYEADRIYTMEELDGLFEQLKEIYPEKYPLGQLTAGHTFSTYQFFYGIDNPFGDGEVSGSIDAATGRVVNFYETANYQKFLDWMRTWYESGYIYPAAAYTGFSSIELIKDGDILSIPQNSIPGMISAEDVGEEVVCLLLSKVVQSNSSSRGTFWVIPSTCQDPAKAMKFLNLMYTDQQIVNLLVWGERDRDYQFLNKSEGIITYPEGVTPQTADYYNPLGLYGDMRLAYSMSSNELKKQQEAYAARAVRIGQEYTGFFFDETPVSTQAWQVRQVLNRYLPVLESGCVELEENYADFLNDLREAGISEVIAEKQRQLDAWRAGQ